MGVTILDENGHTLISLPDQKVKLRAILAGCRNAPGWLYGRVPGAGAEEKSATLIASIVYSVPVDKVLERIRMLILTQFC